MDMIIPQSYVLPDKLKVVRKEVTFLSDAEGAILPIIVSADETDTVSDAAIAERLAVMGYDKTPSGGFELAPGRRRKVSLQPSVN